MRVCVCVCVRILRMIHDIAGISVSDPLGTLKVHGTAVRVGNNRKSNAVLS